jgi:hypothetical protein
MYHFHVNPPGKGVKKATFTGIVHENNNLMTVGIANCSIKDQFCRRKGRLVSQGRAAKTPIFMIDIEAVETKDFSDLFVRKCKEYCENHGYTAEYPRRRKKVNHIAEFV